MKRLFTLLIIICLVSKLSAQEYRYYSMTFADTISIFKLDDETKRLPNAEEIGELNFFKFLFPHHIKLDNDSSEFSFPLDSLDADYRPYFEESIQNLEMIRVNDTVKFIDAPSGYVFYYGIISEENIDFNCYMAHLSIKDGELDDNYSRWYIRFDTADISEFKSELTNSNDSLGIIYFTLSLHKSNATGIYAQIGNINSFCVYPNPFYQSVSIDLKKIYSEIDISVISYDGKIVYKTDYQYIKIIDLVLPIPPGAYILKIIADSKQLNPIKLIKN